MVESIKRQLTPKKFKEQKLNKSKGILDDYAVRKFVGTKEGTITKVPVNSNDITNKAYVDGVLHAPVTVTDSSTIDFTLTTQNITASTIDAAIDHNALLNYAANQHFLVGAIDHTAILNIGTNSHAQIDTHLALTNEHIDWTSTASNLVTTGDVTADDYYIGEYLYHTGDTDTNIQFIPEGMVFTVNNTELWRIHFTASKYHIIFNEDGNSLHFRAEGATNANLFYLNGALDCVGIGKAPAANKILDVNGAVMALDYYSGDGSQGITDTITRADNIYVKDGIVTGWD